MEREMEGIIFFFPFCHQSSFPSVSSFVKFYKGTKNNRLEKKKEKTTRSSHKNGLTERLRKEKRLKMKTLAGAHCVGFHSM